MCVTPKLVHKEKLDGYEWAEAPCGRCWACLKNRQDALTAKGLMEMAQSDWGYFLTLTLDDKKLDYPEQSKVIDKRILQMFFKSLRNKKYKVRYIAAGEYGEQKRRAHYHVALFGVGLQPDIPINTEFRWQKVWARGNVWADDINVNSIRYVSKYITKKDDPKRSQNDTYADEWVTYSDQPPLGLNYIYNWADMHVEQKVFPRNFNVYPPGGEKLKCQITGVSRHFFLERIIDQWPESLRLKKTEGMENAILRLRKWRAEKTWKKLTNEERNEIINDQFRYVERELTLREKWLEYDRRAERLEMQKREMERWHAEREREVEIQERNYRRQLLRRRFERRKSEK